MINPNDIVECFEGYLNTETPAIVSSFDGYKQVEIYTGEELSDAWIIARPDETCKFTDETFKTFVNKATGKWLEKRKPEEPYRILLSCDSNDSIDDITKEYIHELRHVLDYGRATMSIEFSEQKPGGLYFRRYSEYNAEKAATRFMAKNWIATHKNLRSFDCLAAVLGILSADAVHGVYFSDNVDDITYYVSRYLGAQRAIRNLSEEVSPSVAFQLWNLTPFYFEDNYGSIFYLAEEWDDIAVCELDASSRRFDNVIARIKTSLQKKK